MRYIVFLSAIWLVFVSCTSAPPAEGQVEEDSAQQSDGAPVVQEAATEPEMASADIGAIDGSEGDFPTDEFLPLADEEEIPLYGGDSSGLPADDGQEYLEEIEIVDLEEPLDDGAGLEHGQDEPARILEPEVALVVEAPSESADTEAGAVPEAEESDEVALVVEEVDPSEPMDEAPAAEAMQEENVVLVDSVDEAVAEIVVEEELVEDVEPVEAATTQGVLAPVDPSRSVSMDNRQYLDIRYPGAGWVYLGEVTREGDSIGTPSLTYFGRRRTSEDTSFTLRSTRPGTTILHFYKQDVLSATFIDDFLEVTISEEEAELGSRIVAPSYGSIVPAYQDTIPQVLAYSDEAPAEESSPADRAEPALPSVPPMDSTEEQSQIPMEQGTTDAGNPAAPAQEIPPEQPVVSDIAAVPDGQAAGGETGSVEPVAPDVVPPPMSASGNESSQITPPEGGEVAVQEEELVQAPAEREQPELPVQSPDPGGELSADEPWGSQELEQQGPEAGGSASPEVALLLPQDQNALLAQAQEYFYVEDFSASLETLDQFFAVATDSFDAAYYLKGQVLESNSSVRNIREAQKAYKHVIDSYPQSPFWERAKKRHTYLSRLYFDIR